VSTAEIREHADSTGVSNLLAKECLGHVFGEFV